MYTLILVIMIIAAIVLIAVVLLQPGKGDLSSSLGGFGSQMGSMFGMQRTANILAKITKYLAAGIIILAIAANGILSCDRKSGATQQQQNTEGGSVINRNREEARKSMPQQVPQQAQPQQQGGQQAQPQEQKQQEQKPAETQEKK